MQDQTTTGTPHIVTEQDLIDNPDLVTQGLKVGDEISLLPEEPAPAEATNPQPGADHPQPEAAEATGHVPDALLHGEQPNQEFEQSEDTGEGVE